MVKRNDIMTGINKLIAAVFSQHPVYIQRCPKDFKRPSFLLEYVKLSQRDVSHSIVEKTAYFTITCFTVSDDYYRSDMDALAELQDTVMELFSCGYVTVGDRAIKVQSSTGGIDFGQAYIDLQFEYSDDRSDAVDDTPLIKEVYTTVKEE